MLLDNMNDTNLDILCNNLMFENPHNPQIRSWVYAEIRQRMKLKFKEKVWQKQKKKKQNGG